MQNAGLPRSLTLVCLLTLPPLLWAGNAVMGRFLVSQYPPIALNAARWWLACILLLPLGWRVWQQPKALKEHWLYFCVLGFLGVGCYNALQYAALQTSTALNVTLIAASMPVWMLIMGAIFYHVRPRALELLGAALSIAGVAVVMSRGQWALLRKVSLSAGDLLMLLAVTAWALYSWMLVRPPSRWQSAQRPPWNWAQMLLPQVIFGMAWATLAAGIEATYWHPPPTSGPGLNALSAALCLFYLALGPSILAFRCWGLGVSIVGPAHAAIFANLTPVFTALLSAALLGEKPQAYHALAFGLIAAGIGVCAWRRPSTPLS